MVQIGNYTGPGLYTLKCVYANSNYITVPAAKSDGVIRMQPTINSDSDYSQIFLIREVGTFPANNSTSPVVQIVNFATGQVLTAPATAGDAGYILAKDEPPPQSASATYFFITLEPNSTQDVIFRSVSLNDAGVGGKGCVLDVWRGVKDPNTPVIAFQNHEGDPNDNYNQTWTPEKKPFPSSSS